MILPGAVVLLQQDDLRVGIVLLEALHVAPVCAAPAIDRLVGITDHEDVLVRRSQVFDQRILRDVGILEFVHQHVPETLGIFLANFGVIFQQARGVNQDVVKINSIAGDQSLLVFQIHPFHNFITIGVSRVIIRADQLVLGVGNGRMHAVRPVQLFVQVEFADDALREPYLVVGIENDVVGLHRQKVRFAAQDAGAGRVEGAEHHPLRGLLTEQVAHTRIHFARGFVGECDRQNLVRTHSLVGDQIGHALG